MIKSRRILSNEEYALARDHSITFISLADRLDVQQSGDTITETSLWEGIRAVLRERITAPMQEDVRQACYEDGKVLLRELRTARKALQTLPRQRVQALADLKSGVSVSVAAVALPDPVYEETVQDGVFGDFDPAASTFFSIVTVTSMQTDGAWGAMGRCVDIYSRPSAHTSTPSPSPLTGPQQRNPWRCPAWCGR